MRRHTLDLLIGAVTKLDYRNGERQNVLAFIQSCYCGRVTTYDLGRALNSLQQLTEEEQYTLISWVVVNDDLPNKRRIPTAA